MCCNPNVIRNDVAVADIDWSAAGLCPAGLVERVNDYYVNGDQRLIEGFDTSIVYSIDTDMGIFAAKFVNVHYDTKNQKAGGDAKRITDAGQTGGVLADVAPVGGAVGATTFLDSMVPLKINTRSSFHGETALMRY